MRQFPNEGSISVLADFLQCRSFNLVDDPDSVSLRKKPLEYVREMTIIKETATYFLR
jgi:hypothetical protein